MSMPTIPNITPIIDIDREQALTMILASIALEEMGLAHIINAESEKIQYVLSVKTPTPCSIAEIQEVNQGVERVIREIMKLQMLLQEKLEHVISLTPKPPKPPHSPCNPPCHHPGCSPPKPKCEHRPNCTLIGCGEGYISNPADDFHCGNVTIDVSTCLACDTTHACLLKYSLCTEQNGAIVSAILRAVPKSVRIRCLNYTPCPSAHNPNTIKLKGRGIMVIRETEQKTMQCVVTFTLLVRDCGCYREFHMQICAKNPAFNHDSGVVSVSEGNLAIKNTAAHRESDELD